MQFGPGVPAAGLPSFGGARGQAPAGFARTERAGRRGFWGPRVDVWEGGGGGGGVQL